MNRQKLPKILTAIVVLFSFSILLPAPSSAAINQTLNFQAKIVDKTTGLNVTTGSPACVKSGADTCDFQVRIWNHATNSSVTSGTGNLMFTEIYTDVEIGSTNGIVNLVINSCGSVQSGTSEWGTTVGACTVVDDSDADSDPGVNFDRNDLYLEVSFAPADTSGSVGSMTEVFSRQQLRSVPTAFHAQNASTLEGLTADGFVKLAPSSAQSTSSANSVINITSTGATSAMVIINENGAGSPNLLNLQVAGVNNFTVNNAGTVNFTGDLVSSNSNPIFGTNNGILRFQSTDGWRFETYNTGVIQATVSSSGGAVFNNQATSTGDVQIKGDTNDNLFFADVSSDRVGIGTNSPTNTFTVVGDGGTADIMVQSLSTSYEAELLLQSNKTWSLRSNASGNQSRFDLINTTDGITALTASSAGNIGIGVVSPTSKLHVVGTSTLGAAGISGINSAAHTTTLSGANPTTYATIDANSLDQMTLVGTNTNQTVTDAATLAITGAPVKSTNVALTNTHGLLIRAGAVSTASNSYGLTVNAQTGATNNYAAAFLGGSVGIGTTAPGEKLEVYNGDIYVNAGPSGGSRNRGLIFGIDGARTWAFGNMGGNGNTFVLSNDGLIGTATGGRMIVGNGVGGMTIGRGLSTSDSGSDELRIFDNTATTGITSFAVQAGAGQGTTNLVELRNNAGTAQTVFDESGYLGIGTNNPYTPIEIRMTASGTRSSNLRLWNVGSGLDTAASIGFTYAGSLGTDNYDAAFISAPFGASGAELVFAVGGNGSAHGTEKLRINGSGYLGIGDSSPGAHLVIGSDAGMTNVSGVTDAYIQGDLEVDGTIYGNISGTINPGFTTGSVIFQGGSGLSQDNSNFFWDDTNNRLGIGTAGAPGNTLHVRTSGNTSGTNGILFQNSSSNTLFQIRDDGRVITLHDASGITVAIQDASSNGRLQFSSNNGDLYGWSTSTLSNAAGTMLTVGQTTSHFSNKLGIGSTPTAGLDALIGVTAASGVAYGTRLQQTLTAVANNDATYGLYINPTYTNGVFTGVTNTAIFVNTGAAGAKGLIIRGAASQSANYFEVQNNAGTSLVSINSSGRITIPAGQTLQDDGGNGSISFNGNNATVNGWGAVLLTTAAGTAGDISRARVLLGGGGVTNTLGTTSLDVSINLTNASVINAWQGGVIGLNAEPTVAATANNDVMVGVRLFPHFNVGAFTGLTKIGTMMETSDASTITLVVKGASSQTANLLELRNSGGTILSAFNSSGHLGLGDSTPGAQLVVGSDAGMTSVSGATDAYIQGDLEVDGTIYGNISGTVNPGFTTGSVIFQGASGLAQDNSNFFWDDTNNRLGIGTTTFDDPITGNSKFRIVDGSTILSFRENLTGQGYISVGNGLVAGFTGHTNTQDGFVVGTFSAHNLTLRSQSNGNSLQIQANAKTIIQSAGSSAMATADGQLDVRISASGTKGITIRSASSQSANLQEWQNSSGTPLSSISSTGVFTGSINPSFTTGSVAFQGASGLTQDNGNFFWDDTNNRLGIGTASPGAVVHFLGAQPVDVGTATGTASTNILNIAGGVGGTTTIATTGTGGIGGALSISSGTGGVANAAATSSTGGAGGLIGFTGGTGGAAAIAGTGSNTGGAGGGFTVTAGIGGAATGNTSGTNTGGTGGAITLTGGTGGAASTGSGNLVGGTGGGVTISAGTGGVGTTSGGNGGLVTIQGGAAAAMAGAAGGGVNVTARVGSATGTGGAGGAINITGGAAGGDNTINRAGGAVTITAGASRGPSQAGGTITLTAGAGGSNTATGTQTGPNGGGITFTMGAGGTNTGADVASTGGNGGAFTITGGAGAASSFGGSINNTGGVGSAFSWTAGTGGAANGATSGANLGGAGGSITLQSGTGGVSNTGSGSRTGGAGGAMTLRSGTGGGGASIDGGAGGALTLIAGAGGTGSSTSGTGGAIIFQTAATVTLAERMRINANGFIGVGNITDAEYLVTIQAADTTASQLGLRSMRTTIVATNIIGGIDFKSNDTNLTAPGTSVAGIKALANTTHTASALGTDLTFSTTEVLSQTEKMRITGGGNVGVGTTAPISKVEIIGSGRNDLLAIGSASPTAGSWSQVGGDGLNSSWAAATYETINSMIYYNGYLYASTGNSAGDAEVWQYNGTAWTQVGGDGLNSSWNTSYEVVRSAAVYNNKLIVGIGLSANEAEVWEYNGTTWRQIGGDSISSSWSTGYEAVNSLTTLNGKLYAGVGESTGDAEVWEYNGTAWTQVGGDGLNSSWAAATYENVSALISFQGKVYAGIGNSTGDAEVWEYNGTAWTQIGGDSVNSSWTNASATQVLSFGIYNNQLYAGTGGAAGDGDLWVYNGTAWTQIGGDAINSSWAGAVYEGVLSQTVYQGKFYVGLGSGSSDAEIWEYNGLTWTKIAGDSINNAWTTGFDHALSSAVYNSKLYVGLAVTTGEADVWQYDASTVTTFALNGSGGSSIANNFNIFGTGVVSIGKSQAEANLDIQGTFKVGDSLLTVGSNGNVGIGTTSATAALDVQSAMLANGGTAYGTRLQQSLVATANNDTTTGLYINPAFTNGAFTGVANYGLWVDNGYTKLDGNLAVGSATPVSTILAGMTTTYTNPGNGAYYGQFVTVTQTGANANSLTGITALTNAEPGGGNTIAANYGISGQARLTTAGTLTSGIGTYGRVDNTSTGTITGAYGLYAAAAVNSGGGAITSNYGLYIEAQTAGGSDYGIHINGADTAQLAIVRTAGTGIAFLAGGASGANDITTSDNVLNVAGGITMTGNCADGDGGGGGVDGCDIAETFASDDNLQPGEIVKLVAGASADWKKVTRTATASDQGIGVVSTNPTIIMGNNAFAGNTGYPIGLAGVLPTKVNDQNGLIQRGDYVTVSNTPGQGMKANEGDQTVGIALEDQVSAQDTINILVSRNNSGNGTSTRLAQQSDRIGLLENQAETDTNRITALEQEIANMKAQIAAQPQISQELQNIDLVKLNLALTLTQFMTVENGVVVIAGKLQVEDLGATTAAIETASIKSATVEKLSVSGETVGTIKILKEEVEIIKEFEDFEPTAKVFLTPLASLPVGVSYSVIKEEGQFKVVLSAPLEEDIEFDYFIIQ